MRPVVFWTALTLWSLVAVGTRWVFVRFGWHDTTDPFNQGLPPGWVHQPYILTKRGISLQQVAVIAYFLATVLLGVGTWVRFGWLWGVAAFVAGALLFGRFRAAGLGTPGIWRG